MQQPTVREQFVYVAYAIVLHVILLWILFLVPPPRQEIDGGRNEPVNVPVNVRVVDKGDAVAPVAPVQTKQIVKPQPHTKVSVSATAPRIPISANEQIQKLPSAIPLEQPGAIDEPLAAPSSVPSPTASSSLSRLLPGANSEFLENQRRMGEMSGEVPSYNEEILPEKSEAVQRPNVVTTEFSTLAYRLDLERRFADAWGGIRVLPAYSHFMGRTGEIIVYNVVVNRDGTLRRIVNLTALEQSERDFLAVDRLVREFADSVFPLNPIPSRIHDDPFIVRWSIRFVGSQYSFF